MVQPAGTEAQILQETREEDDDGGGEEGQGGTPGTYSRKKNVKDTKAQYVKVVIEISCGTCKYAFDCLVDITNVVLD